MLKSDDIPGGLVASKDIDGDGGCTAAGTNRPSIDALRVDAGFLARFWAKVNAKPTPTGCLIWTGAKKEDGYGVIGYRRQTLRAHRVAFALIHGRWPASGAMLLHACDNAACVNPAHLSEGDAARNNAEMYERQRRGKKNGAQMWHPSGRGREKMLCGRSALQPDQVKQIRERLPVAEKIDTFDAALVAIEVTGGEVSAEVVKSAARGETFAFIGGQL